MQTPTVGRAFNHAGEEGMAGETRVRRPASFLRQLLQARAAAVGAVILIVIILGAILASFIAPYDPLEMHPDDPLLSPSWKYIMGTDELGRDMFSMLLHAARVSLVVATGSEVIAIALGMPLALVAGYKGGLVDDAIMRLMDGFLAFPGILIGLVIAAMFGRTVQNLLVAIGIMNMPYLVRIMRAAAVVEREKEYVVAAQAIGASDWYIMRRTILFNCVSPLIVQISFGMAVAILIESALSFLGLGVQPPRESWGTLLATGYIYLRVNPWLVTLPGLFIFLTTWSLNTLGDALRDSLDPRLRKM